MPYTPYHFGPSGLVGLVLRRWIDVPVFVMANVVIDVSVLGDRLFSPADGAVHQFLHFHSLLVGGLVGLLFGASVYWVRLFRTFCEKGMQLLGLAYRASFKKMLLAGLLGAWFHVGIDSLHHVDVQIFWPLCDHNPIIGLLSERISQYTWHMRGWVVRACLFGWSMCFVKYGMLLNAFRLKARIAAIRRFRRLAATHQLAAD